MPTGYTAVLNERDTTFQEFALRCARAFGALVHMRDDKLDAELREDVVSPFYEERLKEAKSNLATFSMLSVDVAQKLMYDEKLVQHKRALERIAELNVVKGRYEQMRQEVEDWVVPTSEHKALKSFMLDQLDMCKSDYDISYYEESANAPAYPTEGEAFKWLNEQIKKHSSDVAYYGKQYSEEVERVSKRNEWVKQLQESLQ
jgi:hypothetical protein